MYFDITTCNWPKIDILFNIECDEKELNEKFWNTSEAKRIGKQLREDGYKAYLGVVRNENDAKISTCFRYFKTLYDFEKYVKDRIVVLERNFYAENHMRYLHKDKPYSDMNIYLSCPEYVLDYPVTEDDGEIAEMLFPRQKFSDFLTLLMDLGRFSKNSVDEQENLDLIYQIIDIEVETLCYNFVNECLDKISKWGKS